MNHLIDDRGHSVIVVGSPGSLARFKVEYPALIDRCKALDNLNRINLVNLLTETVNEKGVEVSKGTLVF